MKKITAYLSDSGELFKSKKDCATKDGLVSCTICNTTGIERYEVDEYPTNLPDSGYATHMVTHTRDCSVCHGLGYLETEQLKYKLKEVNEYKEYLRLQEKFKNME